MKVFVQHEGGVQQIGEAAVPDDGSDTYTVRLFGSASTIEERFSIGTLGKAHGDVADNERVVIAHVGQLVSLLPEWRPIAA